MYEHHQKEDSPNKWTKRIVLNESCLTSFPYAANELDINVLEEECEYIIA